VGRAQLIPIVEAAAVRLTRLTGGSTSQVPTLRVLVATLPAGDLIDRSQASDVADGALLARHVRAADGALTITFFERPLRLWADATGTPLTRLVRQALAEEVAEAIDVRPHDLDPEAD
jgi:hypothetical protein